MRGAAFRHLLGRIVASLVGQYGRFTKERPGLGDVLALVKSRLNYRAFCPKFYNIIQTLSDLTSSWISVIRRAQRISAAHLIGGVGRMSTISRIKSHARPGVRRVLWAVAVRLSTILLMAFAIGTVAGVSSGGGQGPFASALLSGGLVKSAYAQHKPAVTPGNGLLAKTGDAERNAPQWRVMSVRGKAEVRTGGRMWHQWSSAKAGVLLKTRAQLRTGPDAEVIVSNGHDTLTLAPSSTLELPAAGADSGLTQVIQKRGTINYDIESRILPGTKEARPSLKKVLFSTQRIRGRFEVVTPLLLVGVKGTNFDVIVGSGGTSVDVWEGVVAVDTPDGGDSATIVAGQTASVAAHSGSTVTVTTSTGASAAPAATSGSGKSAAAPTGAAVVTTSNGKGDGVAASSSDDGAGGNSGSGGASASASSGGGNAGDGDGDNGGGGLTVASSSGGDDGNNGHRNSGGNDKSGR